MVYIVMYQLQSKVCVAASIITPENKDTGRAVLKKGEKAGTNTHRRKIILALLKGLLSCQTQIFNY